MDIVALHAAVAAAAPIDGVCVGRVADKGTWRIDFRPEATRAERDAAAAALAAFDPAAPPAPRPSEAERLLGRLVAKGVLSADDANAIREA